MKLLITRTLAIIGITSLAFFFSCGKDDPKTVAEKDQLNKLSETWVLGTATFEGNPSPQIEPDFSITFSGSFNSDNPEGPYDFVVDGTLTPSPLPPSGEWTFITIDDNSGQILLTDGADQLFVQYTLGSGLELQFDCSSCSFDGAKTSSVNGHWVFMLEKQ